MESTLHAQHADEMKGQIIAHKTLIDTVRSQAEKIREADMKNLKSQHQQDRGWYADCYGQLLIITIDLTARFVHSYMR